MHLAVGIQLADENSVRVRRLPATRPWPSSTGRAEYDPDGLFNSWMGRILTASDLYLGHRNDDADTFGKFSNSEMGPAATACVVVALQSMAPGRDGVDDAASIVDEGYQQTGERLRIRRRQQQVSVRTDMPSGSPRDVGGGSAGIGSDTRRYSAVAPAGPSIGAVEATATRTAPAVGARSG